MDGQSFESVAQSWHDFYLAAGSASAALLGLLFVGVSINLAAITAAQRADLRTRANLAFANLLYLLAISLVVLIPDVGARSTAISFTSIAIIGLVRIVRRARELIRGRKLSWHSLGALRRLGWTVLADAVLLYVAAELALTDDPTWLYTNVFVVFVLLVGAADTSWDLLLRESEDVAPAAPDPGAKEQPNPQRRPSVEAMPAAQTQPAAGAMLAAEVQPGAASGLTAARGRRPPVPSPRR